MVLRFLRGDGTEDRLERIEQRLLEMLSEDRHAFDIAASALIGGADPDVVGPDLRETDHRVNEAERQVRRDLVVHASVYEAVDIPTLLVYMSIVKDLERIGDYAKNVFDLAAAGADFTRADDLEELSSHRDRVSTMISEAGSIFHERDTDRAAALIEEGDQLADHFDTIVDGYVTAEGPAAHAVPRALYYRHLKRIVAHLMNLLSAVVMPVDMLDYFDEDHVSRNA